jgi:WD40 repeat protein
VEVDSLEDEQVDAPPQGIRLECVATWHVAVIGGVAEETDEHSSRSQEHRPSIFATSGQVRHTGSAAPIRGAVASMVDATIDSEVAMRLTSLLFCVALAPGLFAQAPGTALSRRIEYWNPAWSPDGRTILFESTLHGTSSVFVINRDGTGLRRITTDTSANYQPNWSPDGQRIVFTSDRAGHGDLYLMNVDGSGLTRLTTTPGGGYYQSSFSPDGKRIVFQGRPDNGLTSDRVFVINADGTGMRMLSDSSLGAEGPRWLPDGTIRFLRVPYPKRYWREMQEEDMRQAKSAQRLMTVRVDGSGLAAWSGDSGVTWSRDGSRGFRIETREGSTALVEVRRGASGSRRIASTDVVPSDFEPSPDGTLLAYTKSPDGYAGLYVYDISAGEVHFLTGGSAAGPLGYLRTATLTASSDTLDTYTSPKTGGPRTAGGSFYVRTLRHIGAQRWELTDSWADSSGRINTRQTMRTTDGTLATETETVRADRDSASLLVSRNRVTAWVVPEGATARLFDGPPAGERYSTTIVVAAIAKAKPAIGSTYYAPVVGLYSANPLLPLVDSLRVVARDTVIRSGASFPVLVIERPGGTRYWVDESTGVQVAARGNAGPERWWWHIRRDVRLREQ